MPNSMTLEVRQAFKDIGIEHLTVISKESKAKLNDFISQKENTLSKQELDLDFSYYIAKEIIYIRSLNHQIICKRISNRKSFIDEPKLIFNIITNKIENINLQDFLFVPKLYVKINGKKISCRDFLKEQVKEHKKIHIPNILDFAKEHRYDILSEELMKIINNLDYVKWYSSVNAFNEKIFPDSYFSKQIKGNYNLILNELLGMEDISLKELVKKYPFI